IGEDRRIEADDHDAEEGQRNAEPAPPVNLFLEEDDRHDGREGYAELARDRDDGGIGKRKPEKEEAEADGPRAERDDDDFLHPPAMYLQKRKEHEHDQREAQRREEQRRKMVERNLRRNERK